MIRSKPSRNLIYLAISGALLMLSLLFQSDSLGTWMLSASQLVLLLDQWRRRRVTGVAGFVFMSFLFFGVRPLYLALESDYRLLNNLFRVYVGLSEINAAMWWATFGLLAFCIGSELPPIERKNARGAGIEQPNGGEPIPLASHRMASFLLLYQIISLPIMLILASSGRALYGSTFGAYVYDMPVPLQSGHILAIVVILERFLRKRHSAQVLQLVVSVLCFLYFTWLMREVSIFRGFYVAGIMIAGIAVLSRLRRRVSLAWLVVPVVVVQPLFATLGQQRGLSNDEIAAQGIVEATFGDESIVGTYWRFYDSSGDMNIFDTFVAAREADIAKRPYALSWLYVPVHFVPRAIWKSKPSRGVLQDLSFMNGAPYCPGIAGFFLLDGGEFWMIGCMLILGYLVATLDRWVLALPISYLRCCLIGIVSVNAMFLSRFFLWQYFYQLVYAIVPCLIFAWLFRCWAARKRRHSFGMLEFETNAFEPRAASVETGLIGRH